MRFLVDTGASKNFIRPYEGLKGVRPVEAPFKAHSIHGVTNITKKCFVSIFNLKATFFLLPDLSSFDGIIGLDLLKQAGVSLCLASGQLKWGTEVESIDFHTCPDVNFTEVDCSDAPPLVRKAFLKMLSDRKKTFADPNEALSYNTSVVATIRTIDETPIYAKLYPYPMGAADFVNGEIQDLLKNGIIQKSKSPYNNPIWVVDKKGTDETGRRKMRLVLDFRKLNEKTIPDRYPMPNISMILGNLGKAKYFTTLDLKSGYHQITLAECDREKTSFSVNGGKYEFRRMPFGLKNAASIFQRTIDDILREQIGKFCYVYVDDVIVFSEDENSHIRHVDWVLKSLHDANMRVSTEKSRFFKKSVSFLGFIVTNNGATTDPEKIKAIQEFPEPKNIFEVRSFLGLASYYRCFIKDFASIARPITDILKGELGSVSRHRSRNIQVQFNEPQRQAFQKLRNILASEDVILRYPDYQKAFDLTTDASAYGIGAVLSQEGRPITMISRTLKDREVNYATNERELLAIVWALAKLRHYLYAVKDINIFTDHQPLTFAVSESNPNAKIKRWKARIDESGAKIFYKPGKDNLVADALSRQQLNVVEEEEAFSSAATIHSELSLTYTIETTDKPLNCFQNQITLEEARFPLKRSFVLFGNKRRHVINFSCKESLLDELADIIVPKGVNAIHCDLPTLAMIQDELVRQFPATKFWHCKNRVTDIFAVPERREILTVEHNRAHRSAQENVKQILSEYYFPKMAKLATEIVANCKTCAKAKYDRHPKKHELGETPIPSHVGELLHIDIFSTDKKYFLTCIDKFSKFAVVQHVHSRTIEDLKPAILQIMNFFPRAKVVYCDNEPSLNSHTISAMLDNHFGVSIANAPPLHSVSNGQVERFHSTLLELARCLKIDKKITDTVEIILLATAKYNKSIHSVVDKRPVDIMQKHPNDPQTDVQNKIVRAQNTLRARENASRQCRTFEVGEKVLVKSNRRLGNKLTPLCEEKAVEADLGTTVLIKGRVVHKDNIR